MFIYISTLKKKSSICNSKFKIKGGNVVTTLKEKYHNWKNTSVKLQTMNCT